MGLSASMTLVALFGSTTALPSSGPVTTIEARPLGADGLSSGARVLLSSSNPAVAKVTTAEQLGHSPAGVVGVSPGSATITATAQDNTAITATLAITVV